MTDDAPDGLIIKKSERCPRCKGPVFRRPCPCFMRGKWAVCARCLNPRCAYVFGLKRRIKKRK